MQSMSSEPERRTLVLRSALDLCLLTLVQDGSVYGYELTRRLAERGLPVAEGSAYPLLARLERAGLLRSETRAEGGGRPRKYYAITPAGHHALAVGREEWVETSDAVRAALVGAPGDLPGEALHSPRTSTDRWTDHRTADDTSETPRAR